jgi:integrase
MERSRSVGKLTAVKVKALVEPGRYLDGNGLLLVVGSKGAKSWILRAQSQGKRRDFGLGSASLVSLAEAREAAIDLRRQLYRGIDPIAAKALARQSGMTFREAAELVHEERKAGWKNGKHQAQWLITLERYAFPDLGDLAVEKIEGPIIRDVLAKIWLSKPETARRVRQRIGTVLDWAYAKGLRASEAPMRSLSKGLPRQPKKDVHFAALSYEKVPALIAGLRERVSMGRLALEFLILTAARSGEVRLATVSEIDFEARLWSIPAERMKMGRPHQVPLSAAAIAVLKQAAKYRSPRSTLIFEGQRAKRPLSDMTLLKVVRDMDLAVTVHGFRSAFRDWVADATDYPGEVAEAALAHAVANRVEAAYKRTDFLQKRRALMDEWASFCASDRAKAKRKKPVANVLTARKAR